MSRNFPKAVLVLLATMAAIAVIEHVTPPRWHRELVFYLGCSLFFDGVFIPERLYTAVTAIFVHASWFHLLANAVWIVILGPRIHAEMGPARFVFFFLACGVCGNLTHAFYRWAELSFVIGASGAGFGLLGAGAYVLTRSRGGGRPQPRNILHYIVVVAVLIVGYAVLMADKGVSWEAHAGGFAAGLVMFPLFRQRKQTFPPHFQA